MQLLNIYITSGKSSGCQLKLLGSQSTPVRAIKRGFFPPGCNATFLFYFLHLSSVRNLQKLKADSLCMNCQCDLLSML